MTERLRVAMIGAGNHACHVHYPSLARLEDVEIVAAAELSEERLRQVREEYDIAAGYSDYQRMVKETEPDAVYVVLPHIQEYPVVMDCLKMGLNVFLEKPPGITLEQTRFLARRAEKNRCITMVGFQRRYAPLVVQAREKARARGGLDLIVCRFYKDAIALRLYEYHETKGVDILTSDAIHAVDLLRGLGGEVQSVASDVRSVHMDCLNFYVVLVRFVSGTTGVLELNWASGRRLFECELHAKEFVAHVDVDNGTRIYTDNRDEPELFSAETEGGGPEIFMRGGVYAESKHFMECIREQKLPETHLGDSVKTMELVDRIYHSQL